MFRPFVVYSVSSFINTLVALFPAVHTRLGNTIEFLTVTAISAILAAFETVL